MTTNTQLQIEYGAGASQEECSGILFEIPDVEVTGGMELDLILWGNSPSVLQAYALFEGTTSMGAGVYEVEDPLVEVTESMDFAEAFSYQADYPIHDIVSITAVTELWVLDNQGNVQPYASIGQDITNRFSRLGYSCVQETMTTPLYGTAEIIYQKTPYSMRWSWTVPIGQEGLHWFFIYENSILKNKFSIGVPELASGAYGSRNVLLRVMALGSEIPIPNAEVFIDDLSLGFTDVNGAIPLANVPAGIHTLRIVAAGYVPTDEDTLYNDEFVVY